MKTETLPVNSGVIRRGRFWKSAVVIAAVSVPAVASADDPSIWESTTTNLSTHVSTVALLAIGIGIAFVTVKIGWGIVKSFTR